MAVSSSGMQRARRVDRSAGATTLARSATRAASVAPLAAALGIALAGFLVYRGALGYFFTQDDFSGLARAHGLLPRLAGPWRYVSGQLYFDVMAAIAGLNPFPYHLVSLLAHLATSLLLLAWLRQRVSWPAATLGAVAFATHPTLYQAVYSISGIGEILAIAFALAAWIVARRNGAVAWWAIPLFLLSLCSKESTLLLPLAMAVERALAPRRDGGGTAAIRTPSWPIIAATAGASAIYLVWFWAADVFAVRSALPGEAAYSLAFGTTWLENLLTYLGWTLAVPVFAVHGFTDAVDRNVFFFGGGLLALAVAGALLPEARRRGFVPGLVTYVGFLLPVLPLRHHTYHYYLAAPLAGAAWCVAACAEAARARLSAAGASAAAQGATVALLGALLTWNGALLVRKIETHPFLHGTLRSDPTVDRARIAGNAIADLESAAPPAGTRLLFVSPLVTELSRAAGGDPARETYLETNVRTALADGLAIRLFFPGREAVFLHDTRPLGPRELYAVYLPDGHLRVADEAGYAELVRTMPRSLP